jgi:hypothetical protein
VSATLLFGDGRRVPSKDAKIEIRDEGAFNDRSALLPVIARR